MKIILFIVFSVLMLHLEGQNHFNGIKAAPNWTTNAIRSFTYHNSFSSYYLNHSNSYNGENRHMGMNLALGLKYALTSYTQKQADASHVLDAYYLERSKSQKTIAKYILYGGLGFAAVGGLVQLAHENSRAGGFDLDFTGTWMAIGGGCVSLISVPFFISSSVNARKAASLSLGDQAIFIPQLQSSVLKTVPSASLKIKF